MNKILKKEVLNPTTCKYVIDAALIAKKAEPGQFIILRVDDVGERIPLTIADFDRENGTITIIVQIVGKSTEKLSKLNEGDDILDFVGPLGKPSELDEFQSAVVIGGGLGCAIAYPQAKKLFGKGAKVDIIAGFRNKDVVIIEDDMKAASDNLYVCTDDGSYGEKGFVTDVLKKLLDSGKKYDVAIAIGPMIMMKNICDLTEKYNLHTIISMNTIMIDGTGMCGGCRLTVDGKTKFACVDGPDFDGHLVDFDSAMKRSRLYQKEEREQHKKYCKMPGVNENA